MYIIINRYRIIIERIIIKEIIEELENKSKKKKKK